MFTFKIIRFFVKTETSKLKEQKMQTERWTDGQTERQKDVYTETVGQTRIQVEGWTNTQLN